MSNTKIQLKKSGVSGNVPVDLQYGEPALNYDDGRLYYKSADGSIGYISSTDSFNTINVDSTLLFATSNSDILSINPAFGISVSGSGKTITIGDGATSNIAQGAFDHANTRFSANGGTLYGNIDVLGYANVQNTIVVGTGAYTILPNLIAQFTGNTELYSQVNQQNINANGTADFVVTADNGTDEINYLDMGIAGSTYINTNYNSWQFVNPNDGYVLLQGNASQNFGGNVFIGTSGSGSGGNQIGDIVFVQGSDTDNEVARFVLHEGLVVKTKTTSTSNSSGALVVHGGIGANGAIYGDALYDSNIRVLDRANAANSKAQAAFDYANTIGASTIDQTARNTANGAFDKANTDASDILIVASYANSAYVKANSATVTAQAAFDKANTGTSSSTDQTARDTANGAFNKANTNAIDITIVGSYANSSYVAANLAQSYSNSAYVKSNTNATNITIVGSYANSAYTEANSANLTAQSAFDTANGSVAVNTTQNTNITIASSYANSAYTKANSADSKAQSGYDKANTNDTNISIIADYANSAYAKSNTNATDITITGSYANSAYVASNLAQSYSNSAYTKANTNATDITIVGSYANSVYSKANTNATDISIVASYANSSYTQANSANSTAQASFDHSNTNASDITIVADYANSSYIAANLAQSYSNSAYTNSNTNATDITIVGSYANSAYTNANSKTKTYVQSSAPGSANVNDIWIDSLTGIEYTYISSNSASQWIEFGPYGTPLNGTANIQFADQTIFTVKSNEDLVLLSSGASIKLNAANTIATGNFLPTTTNTQSLGSRTLRWGDIWIGPNTLNMTDVTTGNNAALTVANGVLLIQGANQLQVGQLKFVDNSIESTTGNVDIQIGETVDTANLVLNRNVVTSNAFSMTVGGSFTPTKGIIHPVRITTIPANTVSINFATDELIHIHTPAPGTIVTATISNLANNVGKTIEVWTMSSAGGNTQFNHGVNSSQATNGQSFFLTSRNSMYIKYFNLDGTTGNLFVTAIGNNLI